MYLGKKLFDKNHFIINIFPKSVNQWTSTFQWAHLSNLNRTWYNLFSFLSDRLLCLNFQYYVLSYFSKSIIFVWEENHILIDRRNGPSYNHIIVKLDSRTDMLLLVLF